MDIEGIQVQELEEWGIHVHMLRLLGEINDLIHDEYKFILYYGGGNPSRETLMMMNGNEVSIQNRLQQYSGMYWHFCQAKLLNQAIYIMVKDKTQFNQKPCKMQFKEQPWSAEYDVEEISEKQQDSESAIQYVRFKNRWWFVKFIKMTDLRTKYTTFYDVKVNLGEGTLQMQQQDQCKDIKIIDELNKWFKFIFFHPLNRKQTKYYQIEKQKELFHYIDETMQLVFESKACTKCNKIYALNHEGVLTTAFIKYSEPYSFKDSQMLDIKHNLYHEQCLFI